MEEPDSEGKGPSINDVCTEGEGGGWTKSRQLAGILIILQIRTICIQEAQRWLAMLHRNKSYRDFESNKD